MVVITGILAKTIKRLLIFGKKILGITNKVEVFGWSFTGIFFHLYIQYLIYLGIYRTTNNIC